MSLPDLAAVLWRQRDLLERLVYRLECEQLLLAAGRSRWLAQATTEVESLIEEAQIAELQRAATSAEVARELGLPGDATLEQVAAAVEPPWTGVLLEHRQALVAVTAELGALAEANKHLMSAGLKAVEATLAGVGLAATTASVGYDAHGRSDVRATHGRSVVDRAL
jgi:predicted deacylase